MKKRRKNKRQDKIRILLGTSCDKDLGAYALKDTLTVIKETHVCTRRNLNQSKFNLVEAQKFKGAI